MPIWLEDQGLQAHTAPKLSSRVLSTGFDLVNRTMTREQKQALARRFPRLRERAEAESRLAGMDWSRTRAYSDGLRDEVMVNLAGRDPEGIVPPGEYAGLVAELKERIGGITEVGTGRKVAQSVRHREEAYHGPYLDRAPDVTINWVLDEDRPFDGFECDTKRGRERMRKAVSKPPFTDGGHHAEGMFVASGPNVRPVEVRGKLQDVTPTVLALLGVPLPADLDGRPLDLLKEVSAEVSTEASAEVEVAALDAATGYTPEEEEAVRRRLEDLGYL
jgi:predicted AlkP superfamily phosphohydrolase/phosphomutase